MYKKWDVEVHGVNHVVEYNTKKRKTPIIIDGEGRKFKSRIGINNISFIDELLEIDGKEVHLVLRLSKIDLAVDGVYLESGEKYEGIEGIKNVKIIFGILVILPIIARLLNVFSTYDLVGTICRSVCSILFVMLIVNVPKSKLKKRIPLAILYLIIEYLLTFSYFL